MCTAHEQQAAGGVCRGCTSLLGRRCFAQWHSLDHACGVIYVYEPLLHHIQLLQGVGVLWVCDVADVFVDLQGIDRLPLALSCCSAAAHLLGWCNKRQQPP